MHGGGSSSATISPSSPPTRRSLARLFQNLIGNALKFRAGTGTTVHIAAERDEQLWRFTVEDDGIGVGPEFADRLFGMFARER